MSLIKFLPSIITEEDNRRMSACPSIEKVKKVNFELNRHNACGPGGFIGHIFPEVLEHSGY